MRIILIYKHCGLIKYFSNIFLIIFSSLFSTVIVLKIFFMRPVPSRRWLQLAQMDDGTYYKKSERSGATFSAFSVQNSVAKRNGLLHCYVPPNTTFGRIKKQQVTKWCQLRLSKQVGLLSDAGGDCFNGCGSNNAIN